MGGLLIYLSPTERRAIKIAGQALDRVRGSSAAAPFREKLGSTGTSRLSFAIDGLRGLRTKIVRVGRFERSASK